MKDKALWQRIQSVSFEDPMASLSFIGRLIRENRWSRSFALSAVEEYRRFVYLALVCEHEVTPSDEVDQVWHLHLLYTRHYWGEWTDALGRELHHGPTRGGTPEANRFNDNYSRTLASYQQEFLEPAPAQLWPDAGIRFSRPLRFARLNTADYLFLPRQWLRIGAGFTCIAALGLATVQIVMAQTDGSTDTSDKSSVHYGYVVIALILGFLVPWAFARYRERRASKDRKQGDSGCSMGCSAGSSRSGHDAADSSSESASGNSGCSGCGGGD